MTRLTDRHDDISDPKPSGLSGAALAEVMPEEPADIRIFNQAMMELGAGSLGSTTAPPVMTGPCKRPSVWADSGEQQRLLPGEKDEKGAAGWRKNRAPC